MNVMEVKSQTVLDALLGSLEAASVYNGDVQVAPAVVLWPDRDGQWASLVPELRPMLPQLLTLGEYDPAAASVSKGAEVEVLRWAA